MIRDIPPDFLEHRSRACLLGGAIGDALGAPVEFLSLEAIKSRYGLEGIQEFDEAYGRIGAITDDTQMTLFSAEGLIRAKVRAVHRGICHPPGVVGYAYQRWLHTQGEPCDPFAIEKDSQGWLVLQTGLHHRRAPGNTCLSALRVWKQEPALNDSKGCGTVMRSAPFAFVDSAWEIAWACAAISHGHVEAKAAAAVLAQSIQFILLGRGLQEALREACDLDRDDTLSSRLTLRAIRLAESDMPVERAISELGQGWVAEEALAVAAYCAIKAGGDFEKGVRWAVNHDGDSDSTGSICGNLLGALLGMDAIPNRWLESLELRDVINQIAIDLVAEVPVTPYGATDEQQELQKEFWDRYPGC